MNVTEVRHQILDLVRAQAPLSLSTLRQTLNLSDYDLRVSLAPLIEDNQLRFDVKGRLVPNGTLVAA